MLGVGCMAKFSKKESDLIRHALTYLSEGELLEENGWTQESIKMLDDLAVIDYTKIEKS
jgi:hypothetical protein